MAFRRLPRAGRFLRDAIDGNGVRTGDEKYIMNRRGGEWMDIWFGEVECKVFEK